MLDHIASIESLEIEAKEINDYLDSHCSEDPTELTGRGSDILVYLSRTGKMLADAKYWKDKALTDSVIAKLNLNIAPSILSKFIESTCQRENYLVNWLDRLNRTCVHELDWLRTMISKAKEEMKYTQMSGSI
jgi:hypothetical protein